MTNEIKKTIAQLCREFAKQTEAKLQRIEAEMVSAKELGNKLDVTNKLLLTSSRILLHLFELQSPRTLENPELLSAGVKTVTTAGTPEQLPKLLIPYDKYVVLKALSSNTGTLYIGNTPLEASDTTKAYPMTAGEIVEIKIKDLGQLWIDVAVSGNGLAWIVEQIVREVSMYG